MTRCTDPDGLSPMPGEAAACPHGRGHPLQGAAPGDHYPEVHGMILASSASRDPVRAGRLRKFARSQSGLRSRERARRVPDEIGRMRATTATPGQRRGIATWLYAREPGRREDLTRKRSPDQGGWQKTESDKGSADLAHSARPARRPAEGGLATCRLGAQTCSGVGKIAGAETVSERLIPQTG